MRKIAVVGGGLSGLYAALTAAQHGAEVALYEKNLIGTKHNCGEMFTEVYTCAPEMCVVSRIKKFKFFFDEEPVVVDFGDMSPFVMTDKCTHEKYIKKECEYYGVTINEKTKTNDYSHDGSYIIDATGKYDGSLGRAVTFIVERNSMLGELHDDTALFIVRKDVKGYMWAFPKKNVVNCGDGVYDYREKCEITKYNKKDVIHSGGGLIPMPSMSEFYSNLRLIDYNKINYLEVGNAAGLVNPCLGGGEHLAVISGMLAGQCAALGKHGDYTRALLAIIGDEMRFGISMYEFAKKQNMQQLKSIVESGVYKRVFTDLFNDVIRKAMKEWVILPDVSNNELIKFVEEK